MINSTSSLWGNSCSVSSKSPAKVNNSQHLAKEQIKAKCKSGVVTLNHPINGKDCFQAFQDEPVLILELTPLLANNKTPSDSPLAEPSVWGYALTLYINIVLWWYVNPPAKSSPNTGNLALRMRLRPGARLLSQTGVLSQLATHLLPLVWGLCNSQC